MVDYLVTRMVDNDLKMRPLSKCFHKFRNLPMVDDLGVLKDTPSKCHESHLFPVFLQAKRLT